MKRYIDLTHRIEENMPVFPGDPQPEIKEVMTLGKDICTVQSICLGNHMGTHLDAPSHFIEGGMTVDQIPLETLIGNATILDFADKGKNDLIAKETFQQHRHSHGPGARIRRQNDRSASAAALWPRHKGSNREPLSDSTR